MTDPETTYEGTATYSPEDNKLRFTPSARLDSDLYQRVKAAGFRWAPQQKIFVAPMWTPQREDLLTELCGEIDDEDTSLVDRAEERADRFGGYSDNRAKDAEQSSDHADQIGERFFGGQPILVGHHSEKRARKDHERADNAIRRSIKMWETASYWKRRAAGALSHAKYKELPGVRARRIKKIEAEKRKEERFKADCEKCLALWEKVQTHEDGVKLASYHEAGHLHLARKEGDREDWPQRPTAYDGLTNSFPSLYAPRTLEDVKRGARNAYPQGIARAQRWIMHYGNRLTYEKAMLEDKGGLVSDQAKFEIGGQVFRRGKWFIIAKINTESVTVIGHWKTTISFDEIKEYRPPKPGDTEKIKAATKIPPLCNYPGEGFKHMTKEELKKEPCRRWSDFPKTRTIDPTGTYGIHRVQVTRGPQAWSWVGVFVTDTKRKDPPAAGNSIELPKADHHQPPAREKCEIPEEQQRAQEMKAKRKSMAQVEVTYADQFYPTPPDIAAQMVELADIRSGQRVLEPSAGSGNILREIVQYESDEESPLAITAVETDGKLHMGLSVSGLAENTIQADFLECNGDLGTFDRIVMNPPFKNASDIKHIQHARAMLNPRGKLVAICANGSRQQNQLKPLATTWEELPEDTFKSTGTGVRTVLLSIEM